MFPNPHSEPHSHHKKNCQTPPKKQKIQEEKKEKKKSKKEKDTDLLDEKLWEATAAKQQVSSWADCDTDDDDDFGGGGLAPLPEDWANKEGEKGEDDDEEEDEEDEEEEEHEARGYSCSRLLTTASTAHPACLRMYSLSVYARTTYTTACVNLKPTSLLSTFQAPHHRYV